TIKRKDGTEEQVQGYAIGSLIRVALDGNTEHFLNHEMWHALRNMGLFEPKEWETVLKTAEREGWADRPFHGSEYSVREHYPDSTPKMVLEEAAAEHFARLMM